MFKLPPWGSSRPGSESLEARNAPVYGNFARVRDFGQDGLSAASSENSRVRRKQRTWGTFRRPARPTKKRRSQPAARFPAPLQEGWLPGLYSLANFCSLPESCLTDRIGVLLVRRSR
jgi:hypothetical protein